MSEHDESQDSGEAVVDEQVEQQAQDPIKNVKAEFNRKLQAQAEANMLLQQQLNTVLQHLTPQPQQQAAPQRKLSELIQEDPDAAVAMIEQRAQSAASRVVNEEVQRQAQLNQLVSEYPELTDAGSELRKRAVANFNSLDPQTQKNPYAYEIAVRKAASEVGVMSSQNRQAKKTQSVEQDPDTFTMPKSNSGTKPSSSQSTAAKKIDPNTVIWAELLGLDTQKPETLKNLEKRTQRKSWMKYEK